MFWDTPLHSTQFSVANLKCVRTFCSVFESSMLIEFHNILREKNGKKKTQKNQIGKF